MNNVIMFVHQGNQDYFKIVLKQAKKTNEQNKIVVIGNRSFKKINKTIITFSQIKLT